jgi:putative transposase
MARKKYSAENIIQILRTIEIEQGKGLTVEESVRKVGISTASYARWKKEYGGLRVDQARRLKELESENGRLKRIVADLTIDNSILKEVSRGNF